MSNDHHPYAKRHQGDPQYVTDQYARKLLLYRQSILLMIKDYLGAGTTTSKTGVQKALG
jgi:hypothetical protein